MDAQRLLEETLCTLKYIQEQGRHRYSYNDGRLSLNLLAVLQKKNFVTNDLSRITCENCVDRNNAVAYCKECDYFIDRLCVTYHKKIQPLRTHEVTKLLDRQETEIKYHDLAKKVFCDENNHKRFELDSYCVSCTILVCRECRQKHLNHNVNLLEDFYLLLDLILDVKRQSEAIIQLPERDDRNNEFSTISATVGVIDATLKFQKDISGDALVPIMLTDLQVDKYKLLPVKDVYNILKSMNGYLERRLSMDSEVPDDRNLHSQRNRHGRQIEAPATRHQREEDDSTDEESFVYGEIATNASEQFGPLTAHLSSFTSEELFQSLSQPEDLSGSYHQKSPEQDIAALRQDIHNPFHLESFQSVHPHV